MPTISTTISQPQKAADGEMSAFVEMYLRVDAMNVSSSCKVA